MFQAVFPSNIRSSKLHAQRQVFVRPILLPAASLARLHVHVSDGFSVHHQELKTAHKASGICHTNTATCCYPGQAICTCFGRVFRPSSGAQNCTHSVRYLSYQYCYLLLSWPGYMYMFQTGFPSIIRSSKLHIQRQVFVRPIPDAVCAVLSS